GQPLITLARPSADVLVCPPLLAGAIVVLDPANATITAGDIETFLGPTNVTQPTAAQRATLVAADASFANKPSARFVGDSTARKVYDFTFGSLTQGEIFAVLKDEYGIGASHPTIAHTGLWQMNIHTAPVTHYPYSNGRIYDSFGHDARFDFDASAFALRTAHIYNIRCSAAGHVTTINGVTADTRATWAISWPSAVRFGASATEAVAFNGWMAALVVCNQVQSAPARAEMLTYLATRFGITLP
ncbi:MAG TPA: hypothetical protein VFN67_36445, partial [Polyangiales bacterium]|nr:hypothetical protein [Polyangiales bacterium]